MNCHYFLNFSDFWGFLRHFFTLKKSRKTFFDGQMPGQMVKIIDKNDDHEMSLVVMIYF